MPQNQNSSLYKTQKSPFPPTHFPPSSHSEIPTGNINFEKSSGQYQSASGHYTAPFYKNINPHHHYSEIIRHHPPIPLNGKSPWIPLTATLYNNYLINGHKPSPRNLNSIPQNKNNKWWWILRPIRSRSYLTHIVAKYYQRHFNSDYYLYSHPISRPSKSKYFEKKSREHNIGPLKERTRDVSFSEVKLHPSIASISFDDLPILYDWGNSRAHHSPITYLPKCHHTCSSRKKVTHLNQFSSTNVNPFFISEEELIYDLFTYWKNNRPLNLISKDLKVGAYQGSEINISGFKAFLISISNKVKSSSVSSPDVSHSTLSQLLWNAIGHCSPVYIPTTKRLRIYHISQVPDMFLSSVSSSSLSPFVIKESQKENPLQWTRKYAEKLINEYTTDNIDDEIPLLLPLRRFCALATQDDECPSVFHRIWSSGHCLDEKFNDNYSISPNFEQSHWSSLYSVNGLSILLRNSSCLFLPSCLFRGSQQSVDNHLMTNPFASDLISDLRRLTIETSGHNIHQEEFTDKPSGEARRKSGNTTHLHYIQQALDYHYYHQIKASLSGVLSYYKPKPEKRRGDVPLLPPMWIPTSDIPRSIQTIGPPIEIEIPYTAAYYPTHFVSRLFNSSRRDRGYKRESVKSEKVKESSNTNTSLDKNNDNSSLHSAANIFYSFADFVNNTEMNVQNKETVKSLEFTPVDSGIPSWIKYGATTSRNSPHYNGLTGLPLDLAPCVISGEAVSTKNQIDIATSYRELSLRWLLHHRCWFPVEAVGSDAVGSSNGPYSLILSSTAHRSTKECFEPSCEDNINVPIHLQTFTFYENATLVCRDLFDDRPGLLRAPCSGSPSSQTITAALRDDFLSAFPLPPDDEDNQKKTNQNTGELLYHFVFIPGDHIDKGNKDDLKGTNKRLKGTWKRVCVDRIEINFGIVKSSDFSRPFHFIPQNFLDEYFGLTVDNRDNCTLQTQYHKMLPIIEKVSNQEIIDDLDDGNHHDIDNEGDTTDIPVTTSSFTDSDQADECTASSEETSSSSSLDGSFDDGITEVYSSLSQRNTSLPIDTIVGIIKAIMPNNTTDKEMHTQIRKHLLKGNLTGKLTKEEYEEWETKTNIAAKESNTDNPIHSSTNHLYSISTEVSPGDPSTVPLFRARDDHGIYLVIVAIPLKCINACALQYKLPSSPVTRHIN